LIASRDTLWRILLVDDNARDRTDAKAALLNGSPRRYQFTEAATVAQTLALCAALPPFDCVVLDYGLTDGDALDVLRTLARDAHQMPLMPVVIVTGDSSGETSRAALRAGAQDHLGKSWLGPESLTRAVENAVERHAMSREINAQRARQQLIADCARVGGSVGAGVGVSAVNSVGTNPGARDSASASPLDLFKRIGPLVGAEIQIHCAVVSAVVSSTLPPQPDSEAPTSRPTATPTLRQQASVGLDVAELARLAQCSGDETLCALAIRAKRPIYRSKVQSSDDALVSALRAIGVQVCVCCPVLVGHEAVGTMSFASRLRDHFTHDELDFIERMVLQIGLLQERLRVQVQLRESEAFNISLLDGSFDCVKMLDRQGRLQHINDSGRLLLELDTADELKEGSWSQFWPIEFRPRVEAAVREALLGTSTTFEGLCATFRGHWKWWEVSVSPIRSDGGNEVSRLLVISRDITARRADAQALMESRESLRASERELRTLTDYAPDVMFRFDRQFRYVFVNPAITQATGFQPEQVIGKTNRELAMPTEDCDQWDRALREVFDSGLSQDLAFSFNTPTGLRHYLSRLIAESTPDGYVSHVLGIAHDITDQRELEFQREQLLEAERAARKEGERLAMIKDEFLATLSHELRTPLAAIVGWAGVLKRSLDNVEVVRRGVDAIARNGAAQARLIGDLLDMNRIVSGKMAVDMALVDAHVIGTTAVDSLRPTAEAKGIRLSMPAGDDEPKFVLGDAVRLQQVLSNLLNNAVKFTPSGGAVNLTVQALPSGATEFAVRDTGKGFAASFMPFLFDRFSQADGSTSRTSGGLGLGLSIVKQLVELHGGSVVGHSDGEGQGACFTVTLPAVPPGHQRTASPVSSTLSGLPGGETPNVDELAAQAAQDTNSGPVSNFAGLVNAKEGEPRIELSGLSVLLVDDQEDVLELCRRLLLEGGAQVRTASSGSVALRSIEAQMPDVLISDIGMPEMDGYQLMRRIRDELQLSPQRLPAVALSAFTRPVDHARALEAGYGVCLDKPIVPNLLLRAVLAVANSATDSTAPSTDTVDSRTPTSIQTQSP
jgi:PAS domain S-box-containing protein